MEDIITLYEDGASLLVMTTLSAGHMGKSSMPDMPARLKVFETLGLDRGRVVFVHQKHTKDILDAGTVAGMQTPPEADGTLTDDGSYVLGVTAADCMPIFLKDGRTGARALLHSGWKGTGIASRAVRLMAENYGSRPEDLTAVLGPSIGSCCYDVDAERAALFSSSFGPKASLMRGGRHWLSLKDANSRLLTDAGVGRLILSDRCTCCGGGFSSYRRQGPEDYSLMIVLSIEKDGR